LLTPRPTPISEDQASVFISPRGRVVTHFSRLLRHAWVTVGLYFYYIEDTGALSIGINDGREVDHLPPSRARVKNLWNFASIPLNLLI
jgi:hypothetical protein